MEPDFFTFPIDMCWKSLSNLNLNLNKTSSKLQTGIPSNHTSGTKNSWFKLFLFKTKLMRLDQPPAKIRSKSYSNQLLINFFDPISAVRSMVATILIQIRTIYIEYRSILYQKSSILSKIYRIWSKINNFWLNSTNFD